MIGNRESFALAGVLVVGATLALMIVAIRGSLPSVGAVLLLATAVGGIVSLLGWHRATRVAQVAAALEDAVEDELEETRETLQLRLQAAEELAQIQQQRRRRAEAARLAEQQWARRLRAQVVKLQDERGALGDTSDIRELVLKVALELLHAEKGMLLSRKDEDSDGDLDLACALGFEHDPSESAVAQRFASEVLERDATIREDDASRYRETPADQEIENLVAIPIYIRDEFSGVLIGANKEGGFEEYDEEVLLALGDHAGAVLHNARLHGDLRASYLRTVSMLADAIEAKDPFTGDHSTDVAHYVAVVGERLGLDAKRREQLVFAALLHDVGKIGISERILLKPAALTPEERTLVELHPHIGYRLVEQVPVLKSVALAVLHHHERWDGAGYPSGLRGDDIPLEARVVAVADSFSAMTSDRPYRPRKTVREAVDELRRCAGTQFDPHVVRLFIDEVERRPPQASDGHTLAESLKDPEFQVTREPGEPVLGFSSFTAIDNLTNLYAHRPFVELAAAEADIAELRGKPFAVVMVELTDLARINRDEGYRAGDAAIQAVARAVQTIAGRCNGTAGRSSGRRIALLAPNTDDAAAEHLADELSAEVNGAASIRVLTAVWQPGETGGDVIARARAGLGAAIQT